MEPQKPAQHDLRLCNPLAQSQHTDPPPPDSRRKHAFSPQTMVVTGHQKAAQGGFLQSCRFSSPALRPKCRANPIPYTPLLSTPMQPTHTD